jgi:hypothetical protein
MFLWMIVPSEPLSRAARRLRAEKKTGEEGNPRRSKLEFINATAPRTL